MSSPNHPTSDIEDAFSSNFPDYILASSDYFPASPGNTSSESSNNSSSLVPIASPTPSLFHNNPYMKFMQTYDAISLLQVTILPPTIVPPSPVLSLSPMFDSLDFFPPEEIPPPRDRMQKRAYKLPGSKRVRISDKQGKTLYFEKHGHSLGFENDLVLYDFSSDTICNTPKNQDNAAEW
ncbi:hypothetical protein Tco_1086131 [Tanacetum coccineum]